MSHEVHHHVRIHIDQKPHDSPNPTTGEALYSLGHVQAGLELYREVTGDLDPVPSGPNIIFTITYRHGPRANPKGEMLEGQHLCIKDEMIFNVTPTDKS